MARSLYICYFGIGEPLVQTQVLPYLRELLKDGHQMHLLTFEPDLAAKWSAERLSEKRQELRAEGIEWHCLGYHKRPSAIATAYDVFQGARFVRKIASREKLDILHARIHVPMLMAVMASSFLGRRPKLLFDIRGFFPEEYTDAGVWKADGITYRTVKRIEKWLMRKADGFVVLTEKARDILFPQAAENGADIKGRPVEVVPCCVDLKQRFSGHREAIRQSKRTEVGISGRLVMCHLGSLGGLYLTEEIARFLTVARELDKTTFALFLTQSSNDLIIPRLKAAGFEDNDFLVMRADPADVPGYLYASDIGLSFVKAGYATQSRSPTKIPEYLAGGVRIVANSGVGDVDDLIANYGVGVVVNDFSPETYAEAMKGLEKINILPERCIEAAAEEFDLESVGGYRYRRLYSQLTGGR